MIDSPVRPMQRNSSQEFTSFRPGGGAAPSLRPGGAASGAMQPRSIPTRYVVCLWQLSVIVSIVVCSQGQFVDQQR